MPKPFDPADLPDDIARAAQAAVAAGRFSSVEEVLRAGVEAVADEQPVPSDWTDYLRHRFEQGRAAFARGEVTPTTPDELMDGIEAELGLR
jgi:Arc/MetJ-type ribon-helix-helix transcriptional regulator